MRTIVGYLRTVRRDPLPFTTPPLPDETIASYLDRLAIANESEYPELAELVDDGDGYCSPGRLARLTGQPLASLKYAMPQLCLPEELERMHLRGRPRPGANERDICEHCARLHDSDFAECSTLHEDVLCRTHWRWLGGASDVGPCFDVRQQPEIISANLRHRRLIRRRGRENVRWSFTQASDVCRQWLVERHYRGYTDGAEQLLHTLPGQGSVLDYHHRRVSAALYPQVVALTAVLSHPRWWKAAMDAVLVDGKSASTPSSLHATPAFEEFVAEIRRTVAPRYTWEPYPSQRGYDELARLIMRELALSHYPEMYPYKAEPWEPETLIAPDGTSEQIQRHIQWGTDRSNDTLCAAGAD